MPVELSVNSASIAVSYNGATGALNGSFDKVMGNGTVYSAVATVRSDQAADSVILSGSNDKVNWVQIASFSATSSAPDSATFQTAFAFLKIDGTANLLICRSAA